MKKYISSFILTFLIGTTPVFSQQLVEGIVAIVGKEIILKSEIDQHVQNYIIQNRLDVQQNPQIVEELQTQTLDRLIEQKLLLAKAEEDTLTVEDEILDKQVEQRMRYMLDQVGSEDKLESVFGNSMKKIRRDTREIIKEQMLVEQARSTQFRDIKVSRREVEEFYKNYQDSLPSQQESVTIGHILMLIKPSEDAQLTAYKKAEDLLEQIQNGADFSELAQKFSEDPASAKRGGDLGLINRGDFVPEFETVAFSLEENEVSDIVQTQFGFHIIKMMERRGEKVRTKHILIQAAPTENDEQSIVDRLNALRDRINNGEDFSELAIEYSEDENVTEDKGILGTFESDKLVVPKFKEVVQELDPGEVSEPFKTEYGFHIVNLIERQDKRRFTLENDWQRIEEFALNYKMDLEYKKWIQELRKNVAIEMRDLS